MNSLVLRNLLFTILQPGIVAGLVPYLLAKDHFWNALGSIFQFGQYLGVLLFILGTAIVLHCIFRFMTEGKGTLSPADPTRQLVVKGLYKFSRNPMYVGVMTILIAETIFCSSLALLIYALLIGMAFNLFIIFREEPRLKRDFGEQYDRYKSRVRRWI